LGERFIKNENEEKEIAVLIEKAENYDNKKKNKQHKSRRSKRIGRTNNG
jgi:hypothetical protein